MWLNDVSSNVIQYFSVLTLGDYDLLPKNVDFNDLLLKIVLKWRKLSSFTARTSNDNNANFFFIPATSRENSVLDITFMRINSKKKIFLTQLGWWKTINAPISANNERKVSFLTGISPHYCSFRKGWSYLKWYLDTREWTPDLL